MKPILHGRDHRPTGADPIPGYLHWGENFDTLVQGLLLAANADVQISSSGEDILVDSQGGSLDLDSGAGVLTANATSPGLDPKLRLTGASDQHDAEALLQGGYIILEADSYKSGGSSILIKTTQTTVGGTNAGVITLSAANNNLISVFDGGARVQADSIINKLIDSSGSFAVASNAGPDLFQVFDTGAVHVWGGDMSMHSHKITSVTDPTSAQDAATKAYVDAAISGVGSGDVATDLIWDAKGDLAGGTGSNTADNLTVGSNDQVLLADSSQTTGLRWGGIDGGSA